MVMEIADLASFYGDRDLSLIALRSYVMDLPFRNRRRIWMHPWWRTDPRFKALVRDMGLVDYWRKSGKWADFCRPKGQDDFECFEKPVAQVAAGS